MDRKKSSTITIFKMNIPNFSIVHHVYSTCVNIDEFLWIRIRIVPHLFDFPGSERCIKASLENIYLLVSDV
jgi:hypothetical protein